MHPYQTPAHDALLAGKPQTLDRETLEKLGLPSNITKMTPMLSAAAGSASTSGGGSGRPIRSASAPMVPTVDLDLQNYNMDTPNVSASDPANILLDPSQGSSQGSFTDDKWLSMDLTQEFMSNEFMSSIPELPDFSDYYSDFEDFEDFMRSWGFQESVI